MQRFTMQMLTRRSAPAFLIQGQIEELIGHLPGLWDGNPDSVHRARVATRRLREILPLYEVTHPGQGEPLATDVRKVGRSLGPVRELDVMQDLLTDLETRVPAATGALDVARGALTHIQQGARRRMIKTLERLKVDRLAQMVPVREGQWTSLLSPHRREWSGALRARIGVRAGTLAGAVDHATGVYFPKRIHAVRVAVKKLRYNLELADVTALWRPPLMLDDIKGIQETLGQIHDMQVLLDRFDRLVPTTVLAEETNVLTGVLGRQVAHLHAEYVETRSQLRAMCAACQRFAGPRVWGMRHWPIAVSAAALPAAVLLMGHQISIGGESTPHPAAAGR